MRTCESKSLAILAITGSLLAFIGFSGCQPSFNQSSTEVWSKNNPNSAGVTPKIARAEFPEVQNFQRLEKNQGERVNAEESVYLAQQKFFEAYVQGGFQTVIKDADRQISFARTRIDLDQAKVSSLREEEISTLFEKRQYHTQRLLKKLGLKPKSLLNEPQVWILDQKGPKAFLAADVYRPYLQRVQRVYFTDQLQVHSFEDVSTHFDAPAWVYSVFSRDEMIQDLLRNLSSASSLVSTHIQVQSQSPLRVRPSELPVRFEMDDPRFDQVQAFYWSQKALGFAFERLGLSLNRRIEIETSVGFPDRTNAALTYANQIRLGSGDGVIYRNMARDPSIVIHEIGHIINNSLASLPVNGGGGAINEGLSDYFAATVLNNPFMGGDSYIPSSYRRDISEPRLFTERTGKLYQDSQIVSSLLWQIRIELGQEKADQLYIHTIPRLGNSQNLADFAPALWDAAMSTLSPDDQTIVKDLLVSREWPL